MLALFGINQVLQLTSSAGASSPAVPVNVGSVEWSGHGHGLSRPSCRPWDRGDLLRRLATFKPVNWFGKPKVL